MVNNGSCVQSFNDKLRVVDNDENIKVPRSQDVDIVRCIVDLKHYLVLFEVHLLEWIYDLVKQVGLKVAEVRNVLEDIEHEVFEGICLCEDVILPLVYQFGEVRCQGAQSSLYHASQDVVPWTDYWSCPWAVVDAADLAKVVWPH